jgi:hypothetical protein
VIWSAKRGGQSNPIETTFALAWVIGWFVEAIIC